MESSLDVKINLFRLPYGAGVSAPLVREKIAKNKLIHIFWTVDTLDWKAGSTPTEILNRTIKQMKVSKKDSGIILFHDIHDRTANTLPLLVEFLKQDQRRICTIGEIVEQMNKNEAIICPSTP
jgi:peptidoglycan/xylan/chitin deacetylase (PgdA/CDA1 family)